MMFRNHTLLALSFVMALGWQQSLSARSLLCHLLGDWASPGTKMNLQALADGSQRDYLHWKGLYNDYVAQRSDINFKSAMLGESLAAIREQLSGTISEIQTNSPRATELRRWANRLLNEINQLDAERPPYLSLIRLGYFVSRLNTAVISSTHASLRQGSLKEFETYKKDLETAAKLGLFLKIETKPLELEDFGQSFHLPLFKINILTSMHNNDGVYETPFLTFKHDWSHFTDMRDQLWIPLLYKNNFQDDTLSFVESWHPRVTNMWAAIQGLSRQEAEMAVLIVTYFSHEQPSPQITQWKNLPDYLVRRLISNLENGTLGPRFQQSYLSQMIFPNEDAIWSAYKTLQNL